MGIKEKKAFLLKVNSSKNTNTLCFQIHKVLEYLRIRRHIKITELMICYPLGDKIILKVSYQ